jgi:hypothetical protein
MVFSKDEKLEDEQQKNNDSHVRAFLRLRPMNKLEENKRSKDCIELHDDPTRLTVDSPLQGTFDFTFDMVCLFPVYTFDLVSLAYLVVT